MDLTRFRNSSNDVPWVAVFLERLPAGNLHTGIVYRDGNQKLHRLHFGWQYTLIHQKCRPSLACAIPLLDQIDLADEIFISGFCGRIARSIANKKIPYSLRIDPDVEFDTKTGGIRFGGEFSGLSCATFVVVVFRSANNPLVDTSNWPEGDKGDMADTYQFAASLASGGDVEQARIVAAEAGLPRARPEQVAGACLEDALPVVHSICQRNGQAIIKIIDGWAQNASSAPESP